MCLILLLCCVSAALLRCEAAVVRYDVQTVRAKKVAALPDDHWARYDESVFERGRGSFVSGYDDAPYFEPMNISSPFFSRDSVPWHVSSDGFLAPTSSPLCAFFCSDSAPDTLFGQYQFGGAIYGGGGDWPMIGLYVADLNPSAARLSPSVRVHGVTGADGGPGYERVTVEYRDVPLPACVAPRDTLTAQVEVWANGTIVMRYRQIPACGRASVGLVLSKGERVVATATPRPSGIAAIRYEPVVDVCAAFLSHSACANAADLCGWCAATGACVATSLAASCCPRGSFRTAPPSSPVGGDFYVVAVEQGAELVRLAALRGHVRVVPAGQSLQLDMGFDFPFYTRDQASHVTNTTHLLSSGLISVFSSTQRCGPIWNVCPDGNYTFAAMPFVTAGLWGPGTSITYARLPERTGADVLCDRPRCPPGFVVEVANTSSFASFARSSTYQVYLDASGAVEFRYGLPVAASIASSPVLGFFAFPPPFVGLFRYRVEDPATVTVPPSLIRTGTRVRFDPTGRCNDCGRHGTCDPASARCVCETGFSGDGCERCDAGYYGPECLPCRRCRNGGVCDDGVNGTGVCRCREPFSGVDCAVRCEGPFDCSHCNPRGGYCECGECRCDAASGWGGADCDVADDPCWRHSFDGCEVCNKDTRNGCAFCFDDMCYSTLLKDTPNGHACSYPAPSGDASRCVPAVQVEVRWFDWGYVAAAGLCFSVVLSVLALLVLAPIAVRTRGVHDIHHAGAAGGTPDRRRGRRRREVVQAVLVQQGAHRGGRTHVLGVPLRQVPLARLYESQRHGPL
ncbi:putative Enriched in surface-labeled proteome protein 10 [Trypanosoma cruzi]|uniref:Putative Enriched in surface-labeled proteome protein 10 n=1 Tax=Trypanosoma cruzi TaxID=5693 RepID=A0A2V2WJQ6_TRYCR|nr:putative Enriched in surface-labeled proteome protein 10 [Trypanosoma cruzi]